VVPTSKSLALGQKMVEMAAPPGGVIIGALSACASRVQNRLNTPSQS
jgi:hypothetical protein